MTAYQHGPYIADALEGVLAQETEFEFEILVGEDDSDDNTRDICLDYQRRYPDKIKLFLNSRNDVIYIDGLATGRSNFMKLLAAAKGEFIALCEGDDYWCNPHKLQRQVETLRENPTASLCFHDVQITEEGKDNVRFPDFGVSKTFSTQNLFTQWFIPTCSIVFRNDITLPAWFTDVLSGDIALHFLAAEKGNILYLPELWGIYRRHPGGASRQHNSYRKAIAMSRLYHYVDLFTGRRYRELVDEAIKGEIEMHIEHPAKRQQEKRYLELQKTEAQRHLEVQRSQELRILELQERLNVTVSKLAKVESRLTEITNTRAYKGYRRVRKLLRGN